MEIRDLFRKHFEECESAKRNFKGVSTSTYAFYCGYKYGLDIALEKVNQIYEVKRYQNAREDIVGDIMEFFEEDSIQNCPCDDKDVDNITKGYLDNHDSTVADLDQRLDAVIDYFDNKYDGRASRYHISETSDAFPYKEDRYAIFDNEFDRYAVNQDNRVLTYETLDEARGAYKAILLGEKKVY